MVEKIADAVLYEGYMLYPYRPSSVKNQQRWNFGVLCPSSYCEQQHGTERDVMQTELLVVSDTNTRLTVKVRFLQIIRRSIGQLRAPVSTLATDTVPAFDAVERLEANGHLYQPWQEAVERNVENVSAATRMQTDATPRAHGYAGDLDMFEQRLVFQKLPLPLSHCISSLRG